MKDFNLDTMICAAMLRDMEKDNIKYSLKNLVSDTIINDDKSKLIILEKRIGE